MGVSRLNDFACKYVCILYVHLHLVLEPFSNLSQLLLELFSKLSRIILENSRIRFVSFPFPFPFRLISWSAFRSLFVSSFKA